jgi:hypothetical protein
MKQSIVTSMIGRLSHEVVRSEEADRVMFQHADAYNRYLDAQRAAAEADARIKRIGGVLNSTAMAGTNEEVLKKLRELRVKESDLPLWEAIAEYLCHAEEASIEDIQEFFVWLPFKEPSRPAIESALKTHKNLFKITKRARGKFISIKDKVKQK